MAKDPQKTTSAPSSSETPSMVAKPAETVTSVASETPATATENVGSGETAPAEPAPETPAAVASIDPARFERLESRLYQALGALDRRDAKIDDLLAENARLRQNSTAAPIVLDPQKAALDRLNAELAARQAAEARVDAELEAGPIKFEISTAKQPRMSRIVGAGSKAEAEAKYRTYFGITGVIDPTVTIIAKQVAEPSGN